MAHYHYPNEIHVVIKALPDYKPCFSAEWDWKASGKWLHGVMSPNDWDSYNKGKVALVRGAPNQSGWFPSIVVERSGKTAGSRAIVIRYVGPNKGGK